MVDRAEMAERHGRVLAELSELGLSLARELHGRALAAETPEAAADLALAFHRISRSVRQTLALEARLERDRTRHAREAQAESGRQAQARVSRRKAQVRAAVERLIWTEAERDEDAERLSDAFDDLLEAESLSDGFADEPLDAQVARLCAELGLAAGSAPHAGVWNGNVAPQTEMDVPPNGGWFAQGGNSS